VRHVLTCVHRKTASRRPSLGAQERNRFLHVIVLLLGKINLRKPYVNRENLLYLFIFFIIVWPVQFLLS
jgi:hypothetical protein